MQEEFSTYKYKAVNKRGRVVNGSISAKNEIHLHHLLEEMQLSLIKSYKVDRRTSQLKTIFFTSRVRIRDRIQFYFQLKQLQKADIGLTHALSYVASTITNIVMQGITNDLRRMISEGMSFSEAMTTFPECFTKLEIAIIKLAESTGNMIDSYQYLIDYLESAEKMQARIAKATRYPMIILAVVILAVVILMGFVVPQIIGFLKIAKGFELPFQTIALMAVSDFFRNYSLYALLVLAIVVVVAYFLRQLYFPFRYQTDKLTLKLPVFGELVRKTEIARFMHVLEVLYGAGIPIVVALRESSKIVTNEVLKEASINQTGEFDALCVQLIDVAEKSSGLNSALKQITDIYNTEVDQTIQAALDYLEPGLTGVLGVIILWIAAAVFGPIYSVFEKLDF
ncbi:MAG: type II secretion system F family protein [Alphaproteobacteria bacterium]|nr:type II secretion system F family protein [Alphaproteobacteria bacterium]